MLFAGAVVLVVVVCLGLVVVVVAGGRVVLVEAGVVVEVLDVVELDVEDVELVVVESIRNERLSGVAVKMRSTFMPAVAARMTWAQIEVGNDPPDTLRPCTLVMGTIFSGLPTHTAVDSWGTNPTNQASP